MVGHVGFADEFADVVVEADALVAGSLLPELGYLSADGADGGLFLLFGQDEPRLSGVARLRAFVEGFRRDLIHQIVFPVAVWVVVHVVEVDVVLALLVGGRVEVWGSPLSECLNRHGAIGEFGDDPLEGVVFLAAAFVLVVAVDCVSDVGEKASSAFCRYGDDALLFGSGVLDDPGTADAGWHSP